MSTAVERCACGKHVMERWCGWYGDEWGCMRVAGACAWRVRAGFQKIQTSSQPWTPED